MNVNSNDGALVTESYRRYSLKVTDLTISGGATFSVKSPAEICWCIGGNLGRVQLGVTHVEC